MIYSTVILAIALSSVDVDLRTLDGQKTSGRLENLTSQQVTVGGDAEKATVAIEDVLEVVVRQKASPLSKSSLTVLLVDGTILPATSFQVTKGKARLEQAETAAIEVSTRDIHSVRFHAPTDELQAQWQEIVDADTSGDVLVVRREVAENDAPKKNISLDYLEGIIYDVTANRVQFDFDGDRIPVDRGKLEGLIYHHPPGRKLADKLCSVSTVQNAKWEVSRIQLKGNRVELTSLAGVTASVPLAQLTRIDFSSGKIVYLSDLDPIQSEWKPYLGAGKLETPLARLYRPRRDRAIGGQPLKLDTQGGDRTYAKGLGVHSRTELVYQLPEGFSRFRAVAGIDPAMDGAGHVQLILFGDGKQLYSESIDGDKPPITIDLDVKNVRRLRIVVDFGRDMDVADHLNLCDAKVIK